LPAKFSQGVGDISWALGGHNSLVEINQLFPRHHNSHVVAVVTQLLLL
jgi:hypothetical protein